MAKIKNITFISKDNLDKKSIYYKSINNKIYFFDKLVFGEDVYALTLDKIVGLMLNGYVNDKRFLLEKAHDNNLSIKLESNPMKSYLNEQVFLFNSKLLKTDTEFVLFFYYLDASNNKFRLNVSIIKKDLISGMLYAKDFDLLETNQIREATEQDNISFSYDFLVTNYKYFYKELHETPVDESIKKTNELLKLIDILNPNEKLIFVKPLLSIFPFLKISMESIDSDINEYKSHSLRYELITQILKPYERILPEAIIELELFDYIDDLQLNDTKLVELLRETKLSKYVKIINPYANKETLTKLNNLYKMDYTVNRKATRTNLFFNIIGLFKNTANLNTFLDYIEPFSPTHSYGNGNLKNDTDLYYLFLNDYLPKFFTSQEKFENNLINYLKKYTIEHPLKFDGDYEHADITRRNIDELQDMINDTYKSFVQLKKLQDKFASNPTEANLEAKEKIDAFFHIKFNDIKTIHDESSKMVIICSKEKVDFETIDKKLVEDEELVIEEVLDSVTLRLVGSIMKHCVGSYSDKILNKESSIFIIRAKNRLTDYKMCIEYHINSNFIKQAKGACNSKVTDKKVLKLLDEFIKENEINGFNY